MTLLVLEKAVEYKLAAWEDTFLDRQKEQIERQYIDDFRAQRQSMLNAPHFQLIRSNIHLVDGGLDFLQAGTDRVV